MNRIPRRSLAPVMIETVAAVALVAQMAQRASAVEVRVVSGGESAARSVDCRRMLVGPGVNPPDPYPGFAGFVGWDAPLRLPDGSVLAVYIHTGGHRTEDARTEALWTIRLRVRPDRSGIDLLPSPPPKK